MIKSYIAYVPGRYLRTKLFCTLLLPLIILPCSRQTFTLIGSLVFLLIPLYLDYRIFSSLYAGKRLIHAFLRLSPSGVRVMTDVFQCDALVDFLCSALITGLLFSGSGNFLDSLTAGSLLFLLLETGKFLLRHFPPQNGLTQALLFAGVPAVYSILLSLSDDAGQTLKMCICFLSLTAGTVFFCATKAYVKLYFTPKGDLYETETQ